MEVPPQKKFRHQMEEQMVKEEMEEEQMEEEPEEGPSAYLLGEETDESGGLVAVNQRSAKIVGLGPK